MFRFDTQEHDPVGLDRAALLLESTDGGAADGRRAPAGWQGLAIGSASETHPPRRTWVARCLLPTFEAVFKIKAFTQRGQGQGGDGGEQPRWLHNVVPDFIQMPRTWSPFMMILGKQNDDMLKAWFRRRGVGRWLFLFGLALMCVAEHPAAAAAEQTLISAAVEVSDELPKPTNAPPVHTPPEKLLFVLAVGVGDYADAQVHDLPYADDDARAICQWAETQAGRFYQKVECQMLIDQQATRQHIIETLLEGVSRVPDGAQLILFFAGHGVLETVSRQYHFLTHDTRLKSIAGTSLEQEVLFTKLGSVRKPRQRLLILIDTCHSGQLSTTLEQVYSQALYQVQGPNVLNPKSVGHRSASTILLTAGEAGQKALERPEFRLASEGPEIEGHGVFTYALLRALMTGEADQRPSNGQLLLSELTGFVPSLVSKLTREAFGAEHEQNPVLSGIMADGPLAWIPGTPEKCDGVDNDFDGQVDEDFPDLDHDGRADCLQQELCNGKDDNFDGEVDEGKTFDQDQDGHRSLLLCGSRWGDDCDDSDGTIYPDQRDWANLRDDNCNGRIDEDEPWQLKETRRLQLRRGGAGLGAAALLLGASMLSWGQLRQYEPENWDGEPWTTDEDRMDYLRWSWTTVGLAGLSTLSLGFSGQFFWKAGRLRVELRALD